VITVQRFQELKSVVENADRDAARAEGALKQLTDQVRLEYGWSTPEEMERGVQSLKDEMQRDERAYNRMEEGFLETWGEFLKRWQCANPQDARRYD